jgi:RNA 2',3'-cyclic 3'-phosphodiesterase
MKHSRDLEESVRCFAAITISAAWRMKTSKLVERLSRTDSGRSVRWSRADKLHVTLCFLGNVEASQIPSLSDELRGACRCHLAFSIAANGVGLFPEIGSPKVLWVSISNQCNALSDLARSVNRVCRQFSESPDPKPFRAHMTIGRVRGQIARDRLKAIEEEAGRFALPDDLVESISLVRSELSPKGSRYTVLERFPFGTKRKGSAIR